MLRDARKKLGIESNSKHKQPVENRIFLPCSEILPYIANFSLTKHFKINPVLIQDNISKIMAFKKNPVIRIFNEIKCKNCTSNKIFEHVQDGTYVCEECGVVNSCLVLRQPYEKIDSYSNLQHKSQYTLASRSQYDDLNRLKSRVESFSNIPGCSSFDIDHVLLILEQCKANNEITSATIMAAILVSTFSEEIRSFKLPTMPESLSQCQKCKCKFYRKIDERHHMCTKPIKTLSIFKYRRNPRFTKYIDNM